MDVGDTATWVVSEAGMGPLVLGMPFEAALKAVPGLTQKCGGAYERVDLPVSDLWVTSNGDLGGVTWYNYDGSPSAEARAESPRTSDGLGVGSTAADVLAAHPDAEKVWRNHLYLVVGRIFFGIHTDSTSDEIPPEAVVDVIGVAEQGPEFEYCA